MAAQQAEVAGCFCWPPMLEEMAFSTEPAAADRKGGDFLPAYSPRVWVRCVTATAARCVTATASVAVLGTDCLRKVKPILTKWHAVCCLKLH
jgi:hypothetical protein